MRLEKGKLLSKYSVGIFAAVVFLTVALTVVLTGGTGPSDNHSLAGDANRGPSDGLIGASISPDQEVPVGGESQGSFQKLIEESIASERAARVKLWTREGAGIKFGDPEAGSSGRYPAILMGMFASDFPPSDSETQVSSGINPVSEPTTQLVDNLRRWIFVVIVVGFWGLLATVWGGWRIINRQQAVLARTSADLGNTSVELHEVQRRMGLILNAAGEGICVLDPRGDTTFVNPAALQMTGWEAGELIGKPWHDLLHHSKSDGTPCSPEKCPVYAPFRDRESHQVNHSEVFWRKDGTSFPIQGISTPIQERGEVTGAVVTFQDITERNQLENQLIHSQKMQSLGRLAGGVAHDFNNMMTTIIGYTQLGKRSLTSQDQVHGYLQQIQRAAEHANNLTYQLLAFARRQVIEPRILSLNDLILSSDKMLRRLIGEDIELVTLPTPHLGLVKVDPSQIEQVLINLAVNGRDAMPEVGGKLTIEMANVSLDREYARQHREVVPGEYVMISVSDNGAGMTEEVKAHAFEPFFTTKLDGGGTGLGLATCYGIVNQNGGHIEVDSTVGQGTTFRVYLPRVDDPVDFTPGHDEPVDLPRGTETVLLVEDEPSVRSLANFLLCEQGYTVFSAANGYEALHTAQEQEGKQIHLLLTDVVMPQMGGKELVDHLRAKRPDIKVLFTSGYTDNAFAHENGFGSGTEFMPKPFSPEMLALKVREVLDDETAEPPSWMVSPHKDRS